MTDRDDPDVEGPGRRDAPARITATGYRSVSYFLPASVRDRLKAAWWATRDEPDGAPTLSALVERVFGVHVSALELTHNSGAAFEAAPRLAQGLNPESSPRRAGTAPTEYTYVAYYLPSELHSRIKAAWWALREQPGASPSLSALVERLLAAEARRLEQEHNAGDQFPPAPARARGVSSSAARRQGEWLRQEWQSRRGEQP